MNNRDTALESTRYRFLPTVRLDITLRNTSNTTQKYGECYLSR